MKNSNIIFMGGIHGVGKGTICSQISKEYDITHISASTLLKWDEISTKENKLVQDFGSTQNRLMNGIKATIKNNSTYLLDGHYCLLNKKGIPERIDEETFRMINPKVISIVIEKTEIIYNRLIGRDGMNYSLDVLERMQDMEIEYAKHLSSVLRIPFVEIKQNNFSGLIKYLVSH